MMFFSHMTTHKMTVQFVVTEGHFQNASGLFNAFWNKLLDSSLWVLR